MSDALTKCLKVRLYLCSVRDQIGTNLDYLLSFYFTRMLPGALQLICKQSPPQKNCLFFLSPRLFQIIHSVSNTHLGFLHFFPYLKITVDLNTLYKIQCVLCKEQTALFKNKQTSLKGPKSKRERNESLRCFSAIQMPQIHAP